MMSINDSISQKMWEKKMLDMLTKHTIFEYLLPEVTPEPQPQRPPTLRGMVADIIREGVSGYEYEMDEDEIARQILELLHEQLGHDFRSE